MMTHTALAPVAHEPAIQPSPVIPTVARHYEVLIIELLEDDDKLAAVRPSAFETDNVDEARAWVDRFNERELSHPVDSWAVIRVRTVAVEEGSAL